MEYVFQQFGVGHWASRLDAFIDPSTASKNETYHVDRARAAIGSGGLYGEGYLRGTSAHAKYIPYSYSDTDTNNYIYSEKIKSGSPRQGKLS